MMIKIRCFHYFVHHLYVYACWDKLKVFQRGRKFVADDLVILEWISVVSIKQSITINSTKLYPKYHHDPSVKSSRPMVSETLTKSNQVLSHGHFAAKQQTNLWDLSLFVLGLIAFVQGRHFVQLSAFC